MANAHLRVIALGNLAGELKTSLEAAVRAVGLELLLTREPARAFVELERDGALAVLVDMATLGAEQFCKRARGTERLRSVPVIGMSRHPNELGFARVFAWGADDLVPLGARLPLERRLEVLRDTPPSAKTGFGQAVVAEATTQRRALVGRVLAHAGYDVKFAVDRGAVELYASQSETRLVVISAALGDPRRIIENAARAGALPTWIVTVEARSTQRLAASLAGLERVAVTSTAGAPEDVLFLANELVFSKGAKRREWRALFATPVAFRPEGGDGDEYGFSYDASPNGLYVRSLLPVATDNVEIELRLPNRDERVRLRGKVARRFAFGSGAIASAPPGFSVKLEGPEDALARWTRACTDLINQASTSESMAPRARSQSQPVLASPELGGKEMPLAVPPATVSIESVVAPLPIAVQAAVETGSDVGELLAATLDEQTLTEVGTRPVTIDPDTLGVREERPSEFLASGASALADSPPASLPAPLEPTISLPPVPVPALVAARAAAPEASPTAAATLLVAPRPVPRPSSATNAAVAPKMAPAGTMIMSPPEDDPETPRAMDWESDAKTTVRSSQPNLEATTPRDGATAAAPKLEDAPREAALPKPEDAPREAALPRPEDAAREVTASPKPAVVHTPARAPDPPAPFGATLVSRASDAAEQPRETESRHESAATAFAPTEPPPPPATPKNDVERAEPVVARPAPLAVPSIDKTLPLAVPKQTAPAAEMVRTLHSPPPAHAAAKTKRHSGAPPKSRGRVLLFIAAAIGATAVGMGLALVTHQQPSAAPPASRAEPVAQNVTTPSTAGALEPHHAEPSAPSVASAVSPAPQVPAELSASPAPAVTAAPATSDVAAAVSAETSPASSPPPVSPPSFNVNKLPRDRAALVVHSTVDTHVFVHGVDYGATNQTLMTSCGIRFVRLGRSLGDFVEPGQSYVIKCGKLNELTIEPPAR